MKFSCFKPPPRVCGTLSQQPWETNTPPARQGTQLPPGPRPVCPTSPARASSLVKGVQGTEQRFGEGREHDFLSSSIPSLIPKLVLSICYWASIVLGPRNMSLSKTNDILTFREIAFQVVQGDQLEPLNTVSKSIKSFPIITNLRREIMGKRRTDPGERGAARELEVTVQWVAIEGLRKAGRRVETGRKGRVTTLWCVRSVFLMKVHSPWD